MADMDTSDKASAASVPVSKSLEEELVKLNPEQMHAFNVFKEFVNNKQGSINGPPLDAPGGSGKTFYLSTALEYVRSKEKPN